MLSGSSTHEKLACPYCIENIKLFQLKNDHKSYWFNYHCQFLLKHHSFQKQQDSFRRKKIEKDHAPCTSMVLKYFKEYPNWMKSSLACYLISTSLRGSIELITGWSKLSSGNCCTDPPIWFVITLMLYILRRMYSIIFFILLCMSRARWRIISRSSRYEEHMQASSIRAG